MNAATEIAQAAAAQLFALPVGTRVKLTLQNDRVWTGTITTMGERICDIKGARNASRGVVRNIHTSVGFFVDSSNWRNPRSFAVMAVEVVA